MKLSELREAIDKGWPVRLMVGPFVADTVAYGINIESVVREKGDSKGVVDIRLPFEFDAEKVAIRDEQAELRRYSLANLLSGRPYEGPHIDMDDCSEEDEE